jgi:short-subunit dehydrogenase
VTASKRVLITGAGSGIGLAAAHLFAARGYQVVGTCRDPESAKQRWLAAGNSSATVLPFALIAADLAKADQVDRLFQSAQALLGGIDVLINNAGQGELGAVEDTPMESAREMFEVNYFAPVRLTQLVLAGMRQRKAGAILNLGSIVFSLQFPFKAQYCASKSAFSAFTLSLRHEVLPHGIRVHLFEPGWVRSEFHNRLRVADGSSPYAARLKPFLDFSRDLDPRIPNGHDVAQVLLATLENPQAPVRVAVGGEAKKFFIASRFLSHHMVDRILRWKLGKKGGAF